MIVDPDGPGGKPYAMMESGAIMLYLAEKHGRFLGQGEDRLKAIEWLMWQMSAVGPMLGRAHFVTGGGFAQLSKLPRTYSRSPKSAAGSSCIRAMTWSTWSCSCQC